jgi:hypothetical protein
MDQTYINSKTSSQEKEPNYTTFYSQIFYVILSIIISIVIASIFLYMTKISQTNIIPIIINILYTGKDKDINEDTKEHINKVIDVNIVKQYSDFLGKLGFGFLSSKKPDVYTTKVLFDENIENITEKLKFLLNLKKKVYGKNITQQEYNKLKEEQKEKPKNDDKDKKNNSQNQEEKQPTNSDKNTFIFWYMYNIIYQTLSTSLWGVNSLFSLLGNYLSESIILILFSFFSATFVILFFIIVLFLTVFYSIVNFLKIYDSRIPGIKPDTENKKNTKTEENKETMFKFDFSNFSKIFTYPNLFLLFMIFSGIFFIIGISIFNFFYIIYIFLSNTGTIFTKDKTQDNPQKFNFIDLCKSTFKYKSQVIMLLFSYKLYNDVITNLGDTYVWSFFIALLLFLIFTNVFSSYTYNPVNDTNLTSGFSNQEKLPESTLPQNLKTSETTSPETTSTDTTQEKTSDTIQENLPKTPETSETPETPETNLPQTNESLSQKTTGGKVLKTQGGKNIKHFVKHLNCYQ